MRKINPFSILLPAAILLLFILPSCNHQAADIPFPIGDSGYPQPLSQPLALSAPKKLNWVTVKTGRITPTIKRLDIEALPYTPYDPSGFRPFAKTPATNRIDWNALPDSAFSLDKIPSRPLVFKTSVLPAPSTTKVSILGLRAGTVSISDWGQSLGLQGQNLLSLIQDRNGLIWIGTDRAIYRFDGEFIQSYVFTSASGLFEDHAGRIWYITTTGLGIIDTHSGTTSFTNIISTPFPKLPRMFFDDKGQIWITQADDKGADIVNPQTLTFKHLGTEVGMPGTMVTGGCQDNKKNIWLISNQGAAIIDNEKGRISYLRKANGLSTDTLRSIACDHQGRIWMTNKSGALDMVDGRSGSITNYGPLFDFGNESTFRILPDKNDRIWVATNHGLAVVDPEKAMFRKFREAEGMPTDFPLDLLFDNRQRLWIASYVSGLIVADRDLRVVHPIGKQNISTLYVDGSGKIWAGTPGNGLLIVDPDKKRVTELNKQAGFADNIIQSITEENGKIRVSSDGGMDIIDQAHKTIEHTGKKEGLISDPIYNVFRDKAGNSWITGPTDGVELIDSAKTGIKSITVANGLSDNTITGITQDRAGLIWLATRAGGVDIIDPADWTIRYLKDAPGLKDTCNRVLMPDKYNRMWISSDKGVYVADLKLSTITSISTENGLSGNLITSILPYKDYILAAASSKVNLITAPVPETDSNGGKNRTKWKIALMSGSDGLKLSQLGSWDLNAITKKGEYLWGDAGITIIPEIKEEQDSASTYITRLNIMNSARNFSNPISLNEHDTLWSPGGFFVKGKEPSQYPGFRWDSVSGPYNMPENLAIPYDQNYLQFQFAQAHLGRKDSTLYSYMLQGLDQHWSNFDNKTFTDNYLNLPPGSYTFKVVSRNLNGSWTKPAILNFTIRPPWWQTWWAYSVFVLCLIGLVWGFIYYRSKKLITENRVLEEKVEARTKEVKQQADELLTVNQISQALVGQADLDDLIKLVGDELRDLFKANIVYIALLDKKTKIISFPYQYGDQMAPLKLGEGLTSKIILTGEPLLINKDVSELTSSLGIGRVGIPAASYLGVPIPVSDEIIGVLSIQSTEAENRFAEKDKRLLATIAANVGVAIRKARLFEEVKQANAEADLARKNAEEANAAKSAFLSTVSHELRTPLTSVLGFAKITRKRLEEKIFPITDKSDPKTVKTIEQISGNLNVVISEGERLTNLINDVLDLAKIEAGKMEWNMEPVRMPEVVERAIAATSSLFEQKNLRLERKIQADLPEISGDRDKLIQVVVNLLSNAVKFTNEGAVTCSVFLKDGNIAVGITDTGIGIAPQDHDKVFEQFKQVGDTLTDKPKGTGLGLPICKEIVEHHDGRIWLESELGKGSTFYFMLPVIAKDETVVRHIELNDLVRQLKKRMEQSRLPVTDKSANILVVDDDDGIRSLLKQELTDAGYSVEEAPNGKEAIAKIRSVRPDLIILDVMMPEMNGFDVAAILKNDPQTMEIPIIILSVVQDKSRGFRIGVDRYLTKPIDTALLFSEIGNLLEQGKSRKKIMVVDEDSVTVRSLTDVLQAKGYQVVESDGKELVEKAIAAQPDIIILNSLLSDKHEIVSSLRFEKGLENVLFLIYQ